jgi:hypothetical protein
MVTGGRIASHTPAEVTIEMKMNTTSYNILNAVMEKTLIIRI